MAKSKGPGISVTLYFPRELVQRLDRLAKAHKRSRSEMCAELLVDSIDQAETMMAAVGDPVLMGAIGQALSEPGVMRSLVASMRSELSDDQLRLFTQQFDEWAAKGKQLGLGRTLPRSGKKPQRGKGAKSQS